MKLLFENWRKYIIEVDTDNDGIDDEKELAIIDKGEIEPEEEPESIASKLWTLFLVGGNPSSYVEFAHDAGEDKIAADLESFFNQVNNIVTLHEQGPFYPWRADQSDLRSGMSETTKEIIDALYRLSSFGGDMEKKWNVDLTDASSEFREALIDLFDVSGALLGRIDAPWYPGSRGQWRAVYLANSRVLFKVEWFYEFVGKTPAWKKEQ
jgi:hypothetical protein